VGSDSGSLELNGLRRRYGDVVALDGLSFTVLPGQVFGFLGPNGAGKPITELGSSRSVVFSTPAALGPMLLTPFR
jgi:ABC-type Na+ transport system ATPase subunit NatA